MVIKQAAARAIDTSVRASKIARAILAILPKSIDSLALVPRSTRRVRMGIGSFPGNAKSFGKIYDGVVVQLAVFEETLSLLASGNTFPRL
jgi:hypothetical protein